MQTINEEAVQKALINKENRSHFKLCIDEKICPKCAKELNVKEKRYWFYNLDFIYTCSKNCGFNFSR